MENPLVIRTDFTDDSLWNLVCAEMSIPEPEFGFLAKVQFVSETRFKDLTVDKVLNLLPSEYSEQHEIVFIVDAECFASDERAFLCVELPLEESSKENMFRLIPSQFWSVESNLSLANMDFNEFATGLDNDRIFRGF